MPVAASASRVSIAADVDADLLADEQYQRDGDDRQESELLRGHGLRTRLYRGNRIATGIR